MKLHHKAAAALSTVALLGGLAACGGADRPSKDELAESMTSDDSVLGSVPEEMADCFAGVLVDSDLSDEALNAIVEQDEDYDGSKEDRDELQNVQGSLMEECAPDMPEIPETPEAE